MHALFLHDKQTIVSLLRRNTFLHIYELGDLDDFFWPYTSWFTLPGGRQVALLYAGADLPVLVGVPEEPEEMRELLRAIVPVLPPRLYAHLRADVLPALEPFYQATSHGVHFKMALTAPARLQAIDASVAGNPATDASVARLRATDASAIARLSPADLPALEKLYRESYPGNWFDPRMLETGQYFGCYRGKDIISVAGIHVYSPVYRVAALGNITTHPSFRGQGLGAAVTARLCLSLLETVEHIGLNVKADNLAAMACYRRLGFEKVAEYEEYDIESANR